jgi:NAD(P)-dependent dehydrogenase (short-subunit alcohol dehydrogenase family)
VPSECNWTWLGDASKEGLGKMKLKNKVGLMTASGSGIGRAISRLFAREGAKLIINDINSKGGKRTVELIRNEGGEALFFEADVSDASKFDEMVNFTLNNFGRLDILLNNAAYLDVRGIRPLVDVPVEIWDRAIAVGLRSYFLGYKFGIPAMLRNGGGVIINISSVGGIEGAHWYSHYNCVKAAIINLTRNVALDYSRQNIRTVCICPGTIATEVMETNFPDPEHPFRKLRQDMIPMGRFGKPEEVAKLALFLASDDASFINGVAIPIDGGMTAGKFIPNFEEIFSALSKI